MDNNNQPQTNFNNEPILPSTPNPIQQPAPTFPNPTSGATDQPPANNSKLDSSTAIICVLCILIPLLGALGIHDFVVGRKKEGKQHVIYTASGLLGLFMMMSIMVCDSGCDASVGTILGFVSTLGMVLYILPLASYIWAIVECIQIFTGKYQKNESSKV